MKIAISATGKELSSAVDPRFGRAAYLLIIDPDTNTIVEAIDNQAANEASQGAGIKAASLIAEAGAKAILTGFVGPKAAVVCEKAGIAMLNGIEGTVAEAIEHFRTRQEASQPRKAAPQQIRAQAAGPCRQGKGKGLVRGKGGCRTRHGA